MLGDGTPLFRNAGGRQVRLERLWVSTTWGPDQVPPNAPSLSVPRLGSSPEKVRRHTRRAPIRSVSHRAPDQA
jgi:hypothetical protein